MQRKSYKELYEKKSEANKMLVYMVLTLTVITLLSVLGYIGETKAHKATKASHVVQWNLDENAFKELVNSKTVCIGVAD